MADSRGATVAPRERQRDGFSSLQIMVLEEVGHVRHDFVASKSEHCTGGQGLGLGPGGVGPGGDGFLRNTIATMSTKMIMITDITTIAILCVLFILCTLIVH